MSSFFLKFCHSFDYWWQDFVSSNSVCTPLGPITIINETYHIKVTRVEVHQEKCHSHKHAHNIHLFNTILHNRAQVISVWHGNKFLSNKSCIKHNLSALKRGKCNYNIQLFNLNSQNIQLTRDYKLITPQMGLHKRRGKRIADD